MDKEEEKRKNCERYKQKCDKKKNRKKIFIILGIIGGSIIFSILLYFFLIPWKYLAKRKVLRSYKKYLYRRTL